MLETASTQAQLHAAYQRAHAERAQAFRIFGRRLVTAIAVPLGILKRKGASQNGQPLKCDCPA